jgi:hypothetical protein
MTIHTVATHTPDHDTDTNLADAAALMTLANIKGLFPTPAVDPTTRRGRKPLYGTYTAFGFACAHYEIAASHRPQSLKEIFDSLWFRYTDEQMALIGVAGLRTPERLAAMNRPAPGATHTDIHRVTRANRAEYQRCYDAYQRLFDAIDDTPIVANHRDGTRPTRTEVATAAKDPDLAPKRRLKHEVVNAIIAASITHENHKRFPGSDPHQGILADHTGHFAVDETHIVVGLGDLPKNAAPGNYMARVHAHSRAHKGMAPAVVGVTLGVAAARPDQTNNIPDLCLGAAIHHPTGGLGSAVITIADAIEDNNLRAPRPSNRNQYIVVDGGYTEAVDLNRQAHTRGYGLVMKYNVRRQTLFEVGTTTDNDGDRIPGIFIYNGRPLCPGAGRKFLERLNFEAPTPTEGRPYDPHALATHERLETRLRALTMATSGRPDEKEARPRGGQPKHAPHQPNKVMQVTVTCPATKGTARCPILPNFYDPDLSHLPAVPDAPGHLPLDKRPACCGNESGKMRVNIPLDTFKTWQDFMPGTWEHEDWYTAPRSANERFNSLIKRPHGGSDLGRGAIAPRKAAPFALAVAVAVATTNRRVMETWDANTAAKGGTKPQPPAHKNRTARAAALATYKAARTGTARRKLADHTTTSPTAPADNSSPTGRA